MCFRLTPDWPWQEFCQTLCCTSASDSGEKLRAVAIWITVQNKKKKKKCGLLLVDCWQEVPIFQRIYLKTLSVGSFLDGWFSKCFIVFKE